MWAGSSYEVYKHPTKGYAASPGGFSGWAYAFPTLWALSSRLWDFAVVLGLIGIGASFLLYFIGAVPIWTSVLFTVLFPTRIYAGFNGGSWKAKRLERQGYVFCGQVLAFTESGALAKARKGDFKPTVGGGRARAQSSSFTLQGIFAVAGLTWKAAFRFRLFWVLSGLLLMSVVLLPLFIKDDGTARGFTQILLTYTLSVITALLGLATLWLACGILAKDIEECQLQLVAVKPIPRWQIWLGKWLGLVMLNLALLALAGGSVYGLLQYRASHLPAREQEILRREIMVARGSLKPPRPNIETEVERLFQERVQQTRIPESEQPELRKRLTELVGAARQVALPGYVKIWNLDAGLQAAFLRNELLFVRVKFFVSQTNASGTYLMRWQIGPPERAWIEDMKLAAETPHEFAIPANLFDDQGRLPIRLFNREPTTMVIPFDDGLEVLYREGGFGLNYVRGLLTIACWLALLAALGLAASTFLSFPVAAFFAASLLFVVLSSGTLSATVTEGSVLGMNYETQRPTAAWLDFVLIPIFRGLLAVINMVGSFSPVESLSTGRSISWLQLLKAFGQIVLLMGGPIAAIGMTILTRRELATAQPQA